MEKVKTENILGYEVTGISLNLCVQQICRWLGNGGREKVFACANPHSLVVAKVDGVFRRALEGCDLLTPDGIGIVLASRIQGGKIRDRLTGSDIFYGLSRMLDDQFSDQYSYFFLGASDDTLLEIRKKMTFEYPGIRLAGAYSPPYKPKFSDEETRLMVDAVNAAKPDVLWVGMTAPKQEKWIYQNREKLDVKFIGAIGAVFDFYVGKVKRSHPVFQKLGLEWLPRLLQEPKRLFKRNFVSSPVFLYHVFLKKYSRRC